MFELWPPRFLAFVVATVGSSWASFDVLWLFIQVPELKAELEAAGLATTGMTRKELSREERVCAFAFKEGNFDFA